MAPQTEAACLLETGTSYTQRIGLRDGTGPLIFAGFRQAAFSLYYDDAPIFHFDLEGRWQRAFVDDLHYLNGLDTTIQVIDRVREGRNLILKRRTLSPVEAEAMNGGVRIAALDLLTALRAGRFHSLPPPSTAAPLSGDELRDFLERVARWDPAAWSAQRAAYDATYGPLPFLPPDCPSAVVLQATRGHAGGRAFGGARADAHSIRSPEEFEDHARAVAALLGRRVEQCKGSFLAGADVLRRPVALVAAYLETIRRVFPNDRPSAVHAVLDDPAAPRPTRDDWRRFAALGLRRVSLGVESGAPEVRALYGKEWDDKDLRTLADDLKSAGIGMGVLVLVGAGGEANADRHVALTADLVGALDPGPGDLVSLLDANELLDPSAGRARTPLTGARWIEQQSELKRRLAALRADRGFKLAPYSFDKQGGV